MYLSRSSFVSLCVQQKRLQKESLKRSSTDPVSMAFRSGHGVAVAPTMQCDQQPVSQDLLARVFGELQHVDTVINTEDYTILAQWSMSVPKIKTSPRMKYRTHRRHPAVMNYTSLYMSWVTENPIFYSKALQ